MQWLKRQSAGRVLTFAALLSLVVFTVWIVVVYVLWRAGDRIDAGWDLWAMLEGASSAAAFATVIGGGVVVLAQLVESIDNRNLAVYNNIFEKLMDPEEIEARRWIYLNLPDDPEVGLANLDPVGQQHVKRVLNSFDHLGFLLQQNWITTDAIIIWVSPIVVKVWEKLGPYVDYEAVRRNEPDYYSAVRFLSSRCRAWREKNLPHKDVVWVEDAL
nr:hypothetical protein [Anaerolineae bacterium]